jgi:hypothetical protein
MTAEMFFASRRVSPDGPAWPPILHRQAKQDRSAGEPCAAEELKDSRGTRRWSYLLGTNRQSWHEPPS